MAARKTEPVNWKPWEAVPLEPMTRCKHGRTDCPRCGTTSRRDGLHTTRGGRGVVARIRRR